MSGILGPKKAPPSAPAQPERWLPVPGKPHLEQNSAGQWRIKAGVNLPGPRK
jgi:hypothetical protein